jgi:hypothetical protein
LFPLSQELDLDTTESSTRIGVDADAVATLAPLGALRRLSSLSITSCTPALTGPLAAALAPRVTSLCLKWASIGATLEPVAALTNLRALSLGFRPLHIGADWLEPLLGLAGGLTSLELSATLNFLQGEDLQVRGAAAAGLRRSRQCPRPTALAALPPTSWGALLPRREPAPKALRRTRQSEGAALPPC